MSDYKPRNPYRTITRRLEDIGYRYDTPTFQDLQGSGIESFKVYCTSEDCCLAAGIEKKKIEMGSSKARILKFDAMTRDRCNRPTDCPDCGHALLYEVIRCDK